MITNTSAQLNITCHMAISKIMWTSKVILLLFYSRKKRLESTELAPEQAKQLVMENAHYFAPVRTSSEIRDITECEKNNN